MWSRRTRHGLTSSRGERTTPGLRLPECGADSLVEEGPSTLMSATDQPGEQYTRCPQCATVFRATAPQLAARGGQVRCGHCNTVFDANANTVAKVPNDG